MALYMIGIGLSDEKDITLKGLELVKKADKVYLEHYTSFLNVKKESLERLYGKEIILADRSLVETKADEILNAAKAGNAAFLVVGDAFSATTHFDLYMRAREAGVDVRAISNASILTAIGITGLQLYKFGKVTSIPYLNDNVESPYNILKQNMKTGTHTLFLLDLNQEKGDSMNIADAISFLLRIDKKRKEGIFTEGTLCIGCARLGSESMKIKAGKARELMKEDFGKGMKCLIVPSKELHFMEEEAIKIYS
ncbi:diphthine synthase [Candidatus Woesearchaeota archaeon]|nr:diphthine synthase [Candidatus Woesearchaeota archaeon]